MPTTTDLAQHNALTIHVGDRTYPITDLATASRLVCEARDRAGIGCSQFDAPTIFEGERQVAYVSYNGRVWAGLPTQWKPGAKPLYDNGAGLDR